MTYVYAAAGTMLVTLKVFDAKKNVTSVPTQVLVIAQQETPSNTSSPTPVIVSSAETAQNVVPVGTSINLTGSNSWTYTWNGTAFIVNASAITNYVWKLDGVTVATTKNYTASNLAIGTHYVSLSVTDIKGYSGLYIMSIVVQAQGYPRPQVRPLLWPRSESPPVLIQPSTMRRLVGRYSRTCMRHLYGITDRAHPT